jgi:hypothetical protein
MRGSSGCVAIELIHPVTTATKAKLVGSQCGDIADEFGWVRRISELR